MSSDMAQNARHTEPRHPIQVVSRRTGLSPDLLRAWERRYAVVAPGRSETGRRLYSDRDIDHLRLLQRAVRGGRRIGSVAQLDHAALTALVREDDLAEASAPTREPAGPATGPHAFLEQSTRAVEKLDPKALEAVLMRSAMALGTLRFLDEVVAPLLRQIGERWLVGELTPGHEHAATAVVWRVLGTLANVADYGVGAPAVVVGTPAGQHHELGALLVAALASASGWRVIYLGPDLPAEDIASVARESRAMAVALSVIYPPDDASLEAEIHALRARLPPDVSVLVGGASAGAYEQAISAAGCVLVHDLNGLQQALADLTPQSHGA